MDEPLYCTVALFLCTAGHYNLCYVCTYVYLIVKWLRLEVSAVE